MDHETMRLKCLELATQQGFKGDEAISYAERMYKMVRGSTNPTLSDTAPKARVVGKDGDVKLPPDDYVKE